MGVLSHYLTYFPFPLLSIFIFLLVSVIMDEMLTVFPFNTVKELDVFVTDIKKFFLKISPVLPLYLFRNGCNLTLMSCFA